MDYHIIHAAIQDKARDDISRWRSYKAKHPRKGKDKAQPTFYQSLSAQLDKWLNEPESKYLDKKHPTPFSEKQARYVDKVCPGAYEFIRQEQLNSGQYQNHGPKCPVRYNLNGLGLEVKEDGLIVCQGCNAVLGKLNEVAIA